ncbi:MAG: methyltransferase [Hyphomicrobium sp.]
MIDRLYALRDHLLADARFQRFAAAFPLTRGIARRRARAVFDLCAGFVYSQVTFACIELGLLELLRGGPLALDEIARRTSMTTGRARTLLDAASALGLVAKRGGDRYGLGMHGAAMLANSGISRMIEHHALLYADLADPVKLLRSGEAGPALSRYWPYAVAAQPEALAADDVAAYTELMSASQSLVAEQVLDVYPFHRHRTLLDLGGGDGTFLRAVARRHRQLRLMLLDLPAVAGLARQKCAEQGFGDRVDIFAGNFLVEPLPKGADVATLVRVVHDHDDPAVARLFAALRHALGENGTLVIVEPLAGTPGAEAMGDAYFGFYLMAMGSGRPRSFGHLAGMLRTAGFSRVRSIPTRVPLQTSIVVADV